jgi:predicted transcriptional regulator
MLVHPITASILRHIAENEHSMSELSKILGLSKSRIRYHLNRLEDANLIERTREEYFRGGLRKYYRAIVGLQLPRLSVLSRAEKEAQLLPIKTFLWGYLFGKFEGQNWDYKQLVGQHINDYVQEIAETIEKMIDEDKEIEDDTADLLYFKLLSRLAKLHLEKQKIKLETLGLILQENQTS